MLLTESFCRIQVNLECRLDTELDVQIPETFKMKHILGLWAHFAERWKDTLKLKRRSLAAAEFSDID